MAMTVALSMAKSMVIRSIKAGLTPFVQSSPGLGKSDMYRQIAKEFNLKLIDIRLSQADPVDFSGFPNLNQETGKAGYCPMETFPLKGDPLPKRENGKNHDGWLLLLDEMNHAPQAVQKAAFQLVLDRMVGTHHIHKNCAVVAAGNLATDNSMVEDLATALQSRLVHIHVHADYQEWIAWATSHGIDERITSFINYKPGLLQAFDPEHSDSTFACPRTWEFASRLIKNEPEINSELMHLLSGTISEGVAREFSVFTRIYKELLTIDEITANPLTANMPTEPSILFALSGSIANSNGDVEKLLQFVSRMPAEFQVICVREMIARNRTILSNPHITSWLSKTATEIF